MFVGAASGGPRRSTNDRPGSGSATTRRGSGSGSSGGSVSLLASSNGAISNGGSDTPGGSSNVAFSIHRRGQGSNGGPSSSSASAAVSRFAPQDFNGGDPGDSSDDLDSMMDAARSARARDAAAAAAVGNGSASGKRSTGGRQGHGRGRSRDFGYLGPSAGGRGGDDEGVRSIRSAIDFGNIAEEDRTGESPAVPDRTLFAPATRAPAPALDSLAEQPPTDGAQWGTLSASSAAPSAVGSFRVVRARRATPADGNVAASGPV